MSNLDNIYCYLFFNIFYSTKTTRVIENIVITNNAINAKETLSEIDFVRKKVFVLLFIMHLCKMKYIKICLAIRAKISLF